MNFSPYSYDIFFLALNQREDSDYLARICQNFKADHRHLGRSRVRFSFSSEIYNPFFDLEYRQHVIQVPTADRGPPSSDSVMSPFEIGWAETT